MKRQQFSQTCLRKTWNKGKFNELENASLEAIRDWEQLEHIINLGIAEKLNFSESVHMMLW